MQKNLKDLNEKHHNEIEDITKKLEMENELHLENILESGEYIIMANEYEEKIL